MKKYLNPEVTVLRPDVQDVICTSSGSEDYEAYAGDYAEDAPSYWSNKLKSIQQ